MLGIYKLYLNELQSDEEFSNLKRFYKQELVEECENPHINLAKLRMSNEDKNIKYVIGKV